MVVTIIMKGDALRQTVSVTNPQGFHMRPMAAFVDAATRFPETAVTVSRAGMPGVNGKSILALMSLVAVQGTELVIEVTGAHAAETLQALAQVLQRTYDDEDEPPA